MVILCILNQFMGYNSGTTESSPINLNVQQLIIVTYILSFIKFCSVVTYGFILWIVNQGLQLRHY